jgi:hypothetical protein
MDRPTVNPASKALQYCCVVTYCCVTMEIKSTSRCIATDMCDCRSCGRFSHKHPTATSLSGYEKIQCIQMSAYVDLVHLQEFYIIREHNVSGTRSASVFRWGEGDTYSVGILKKELTSVTGPALSKGPNRVRNSLRSPEDWNTSSFRNVVFSSYSEIPTMVKAQKVILSFIYRRQKPLGCTNTRKVHVFTSAHFA